MAKESGGRPLGIISVVVFLLGSLFAGSIIGEKYWWVGGVGAFLLLLLVVRLIASKMPVTGGPRSEFRLTPHSTRAMQSSEIEHIARTGRILSKFQDDLRDWQPGEAQLAQLAVEAFFSQNVEEFRDLLSKMSEERQRYVMSTVAQIGEDPKGTAQAEPNINEVIRRSVGGDGSWLSPERFNEFLKTLNTADVMIVGTIAAYLWKQEAEPQESAFKKALHLWFWTNAGSGHMKTVAQQKIKSALDWSIQVGEKSVEWAMECVPRKAVD